MPRRHLIPGFAAGALVALLSGCIGGCPAAPPPVATSDASADTSTDASVDDGTGGRVRFVDVTKEAGIDFVHVNGATGERYFPETMAGGVMAFDYDNDGDLDLYFIQAGKLPPKPDQEFRNVLYRNDGGWRFTDVSKGSGLDDNGYGFGVTAADIDNDGDLDVYVSNFGPDRLFRNKGDGTFEEITKKAGIDNPLWGVSAAFADYDNDGHVDLFVSNYLNFTMATHKHCGREEFGWAYCHPDEYWGEDDVLYRNRGDGTFEDVTRKALPNIECPGAAGNWLSGPGDGKAMGVLWTDYDLDGDLDLYVTNDSTPNYLFENNGDGTFEYEPYAGVGHNEDGATEASMGIDAGDVDGDGWFDLFTPCLDGETFTLYLNNEGGTFDDASIRSGIARVTLVFVGYGTNIFDFDSDGDEDIFVTNGHTIDNIALYQPGSSYPQRDFLFENDGEGRFEEVGRQSGEYFTRKTVGRASAIGDIDGDGDVDIALCLLDEPAVLLRNDGGDRRHSVLLELIGKKSNRSAIGALVRLTAGGRTRIDEVRSGSSYQSQSDLRLHFGLGDETRIEKVEVRWPNEQNDVETIEDLPVDHLFTIVEGEGITERRALR